jgi:hypothetical protein
MTIPEAIDKAITGPAGGGKQVVKGSDTFPALPVSRDPRILCARHFP